MFILRWFKKYWPDLIILLGLAIYLLAEYRLPIEDWQLVDGQLVGEFKGFTYRWEKIVPLWIMIFGLDALVRSLLNYRRKRFELTK